MLVCPSWFHGQVHVVEGAIRIFDLLRIHALHRLTDLVEFILKLDRLSSEELQEEQGKEVRECQMTSNSRGQRGWWGCQRADRVIDLPGNAWVVSQSRLFLAPDSQISISDSTLLPSDSFSSPRNHSGHPTFFEVAKIRKLTELHPTLCFLIGGS